MRTGILIMLLVVTSSIKAQTPSRESMLTGVPYGSMNSPQLPIDGGQKKWSFSRYTGISTSMAFFKGGNATIISAPVGLQVNRRLANSWYTFANVAVAPSYTNFNQSFLSANSNKMGQKNGAFNSRGVNLYSSASLGLMYVNEAKTFSISGSISVEKSSYPLLPYYPVSLGRPMPMTPVNR